MQTSVAWSPQLRAIVTELKSLPANDVPNVVHSLEISETEKQSILSAFETKQKSTPNAPWD